MSNDEQKTPYDESEDPRDPLECYPDGLGEIGDPKPDEFDEIQTNPSEDTIELEPSEYNKVTDPSVDTPIDFSKHEVGTEETDNEPESQTEQREPEDRWEDSEIGNLPEDSDNTDEPPQETDEYGVQSEGTDEDYNETRGTDEYESDLQSMDDEWETAEPEDGTYQVKVTKFFMERTSQSNEPIVKWNLAIISGRFAGQVLVKSSLIRLGVPLKIFKKDLKICGFKLSKISDFGKFKDGMLGVCLEIEQKTRGKYTNFDLRKKLDINPGSVSSYEPPDDMPF